MNNPISCLDVKYSLETTSFTDFLLVYGESWDQFIQKQNLTDPFLSLAWLETWWHHFGEPKSERVFLLKDTYGNIAAALFTHLVKENYYGVPLRVIRCWTNTHAARAGFFTRQVSETMAEMLADYWLEHENDWDLIRLDGIAQSDRFTETLIACLENRRAHAQVQRTWVHHELAINQTWSQYYSSVSREMRKVQERMGRRLRELGACLHKKYRGTEQIEKGLSIFYALEEHSWKADKGEIIKDHPLLASFYRSMATRFADLDQCQIDILYLDEEPICGAISLIYANRLITLKSSFSQKYAKYSPGWQLFRALLEDTFVNNFSAVDFYANFGFSEKWAKSQRTFCDLLIFSPSLRGRAAFLSKRLIEKLRGAKV